MNSKKCVIVSQSPTLGGLFQLHGYETIVLSDTSSVIPILASMGADLLVIDKDIANWPVFLIDVLATSNIPKTVATRGAFSGITHIEGIRFIQVGPDTSDNTWVESITNTTNIQQNKSFKEKVLVVDDVVELLEMYETMFRLKGYEVEIAKDGLEGITKAATMKPKYILLDIMMPHMDGFELMNAFYNNTSLDSIIIVNSNIDGADAIERIYQSGADYYIRKSDYVPSQIIMMIEKKLFDHKRDKSLPIANKSFVPEKDFFG